MRIRWFVVAVVLSMPAVAALGRAAEVDEQANLGAALFDGGVLCLRADGKINVWNAADGKWDRERSLRFSHPGLFRLAEGGGKLWGLDKEALYLWSADSKRKRAGGYRVDVENLQAFVTIGGLPWVVYPEVVEIPADGRRFVVPRAGSAWGGVRALRVLTTHAADSLLWLGTGYGEWGGELVGLNVATGAWTNFRDDLHYVTGITQTARNELLVSWSMHHFLSHTLIRSHRPDASPKTTYPELKDRYYQRIAYSHFDRKLYGIENELVVSIDNGRPSELGKLQAVLYKREDMAIGSAPDAVGLFPVGGRTLLIVPGLGSPWMLRNGKLSRLEKP